MTNKQRKTDVLILTSREGHASLAEAIESKLLENNIQTEQFYYDEFGFSFYKLIYIYQPQSFKHLYKLGKKQLVSKLTDEICGLALYPVIKKTLDYYQPKIVICTNFIFLASLHKYKRWHHLKVINVIANPKQLIGNEIYPQAEINAVFDDWQQQHATSIFPGANFLETGWFVRSRFETVYKQSLLRQQLDLKVKPLTLLFVSGYEGTAGIFDHLKKFLTETNNQLPPLQIIVACGKNDLLLDRMHRFKKHIDSTKQLIDFVILPFTKNIHQYMQASDLVIGKAGPNTLFESVATKTPFFATTHIHGLEEGSLDIIKNYKLGFVEEDPKKIVQKLAKIIQKPQILQKFQPSLELLAKKNAQSKEILLTEVKKML